ncbi:calmodulin variant 1 [Phlyctochytrium arcticum]|nr:calmodulin variant 1 [Phlyctochytrium arcticum]
MAVQLSEAQITEFREAFSLFDDDSDGFIPSSQLGTVMRAVGHCPTERELASLVSSHKNPNGVDFPEFLTLVSRGVGKQTDKSAEETVRAAFRVLDQSGRGTIGVNELKHVLMNVGEKLSAAEVDDMVRECGGDNQIGLEDFVRVMMARS